MQIVEKQNIHINEYLLYGIPNYVKINLMVHSFD